ncbi:MAG: ferritin-like domain-containing protein [Solirubrobacteraceae bacterium]
MTNETQGAPHMSLPSIETLDRDGAIREAEDAVAGDTRAVFFRKAAVGGGAVLTSGAIMGMLPEIAAAKPSKKLDLKILNYALTLELLEADFYRKAVAGNALTDERTAAFANLVLKHENIHVKTLRKTIKQFGGKPVSGLKFDFGDTTQDQAKFQATSYTLENTGVHAYLGQAARLKSKALLSAAATIVTIEARHSAAIAAIIDQSPYQDKNKDTGVTPDGAFDTPLSMKQVTSKARAGKYIKGS